MTDRRKRLSLLAAIMGSFVAGLDATAVNVALPAIRADLGGGLAGQQWVSNAYLLWSARQAIRTSMLGAPPEDGRALICCSRPSSDVALEL